ncbi:MAG: hypothetical protein ABJB11_13780 [Ferruginibacter sp.]
MGWQIKCWHSPFWVGLSAETGAGVSPVPLVTKIHNIKMLKQNVGIPRRVGLSAAIFFEKKGFSLQMKRSVIHEHKKK